MNLAAFPAAVLPAGMPLYRVHRVARSPWWFSSDGSGRFDLPAPLGTCYLAEDPLSALLEVARSRAVSRLRRVHDDRAVFAQSRLV